MIDFRYHLVSIIAIFFALAAGIALGAGPLKPGVDQGLAAQTADLRKANQELRDQITQNGIQTQYQEAFVSSVSPALVSGVLDDQRVVVFTMPDASSDIVKQLRNTLQTAGASLGPTISVQSKWTERSTDRVLSGIVDEFSLLRTDLPEGDGWIRGGALLSGAVLSQGGAPVGAINSAVIDAFVQADLLEVDGDLGGEADVALVVAGPPTSGDDTGRQHEILVNLIDQLSEAGRGAVLVGAPPSAGEGGLINAVRSADTADKVSTVDVAHLHSGQLAVVFTIAERSNGKTGHYGIVGTTDGPLPEGVAKAAEQRAAAAAAAAAAAGAGAEVAGPGASPSPGSSPGTAAGGDAGDTNGAANPQPAASVAAS